jgi:hypothetical protein
VGGTTGSADISITPNSGIDASTYNAGSFQIENTGQTEITSVTFDLSTAAFPDIVFDPSGEAGDQGAKGFTPDSGANSVGLIQGSVSQPHNGQNNDEGYDQLTITFDDFQPGESFAFSIDNDPVSIKGAGGQQSSHAGPISGLELAGATVTVEYGDGSSQQTGLFGDGSDGGSQATAKTDGPQAPTITGVEGVSLDDTALDSRHSAATVSQAEQTVTVSGPADATVSLLRIEGSLNLVDAPGYELEAYEANKALQVTEQTVDLGANGQATVDVTLTDSAGSVASDDAGYNYFVATVEDGQGDTGLTSNIVVLEFDAAAVGPIGDFENAPTDPDGDGLYEDVNGDGDVNVGDAQAIFSNTDDPVIQNNPDAFNYNGIGGVDVGDAQALFANGVEAGDSDTSGS